jgi:hypothetical protein
MQYSLNHLIKTFQKSLSHSSNVSKNLRNIKLDQEKAV